MTPLLLSLCETNDMTTLLLSSCKTNLPNNQTQTTLLTDHNRNTCLSPFLYMPCLNNNIIQKPFSFLSQETKKNKH